MQTYQQSQLLFQTLLEMPKEDSSFIYFILEAMDNLCFYSTIQHEVGDPTRKVEITCPIESQDTLKKVLKHLAETRPITTLQEKIMSDSPNAPSKS